MNRIVRWARALIGGTSAAHREEPPLTRQVPPLQVKGMDDILKRSAQRVAEMERLRRVEGDGRPALRFFDPDDLRDAPGGSTRDGRDGR